MKKAITVFILFFMLSCNKEYTTNVKAYIVNKSSKNVKILFYKKGIVQHSDSVNLISDDSFVLGNDYQLGDIKAPAIFSKHFGENQDSIVVIYEGMYRCTHYGHPPPDSSNRANKYVLVDQSRHIATPKNYAFTMVGKYKKTQRVNYLYYTFTEADYNFAKNP